MPIFHHNTRKGNKKLERKEEAEFILIFQSDYMSKNRAQKYTKKLKLKES